MNYRPWDPVWEKIFASQPWGKYPAEELIRYVARNFYSAPDRKKIKILEVGCGPGGNLWYTAREGFSSYGIDGSPTAISQAKQRLDAEIPGWVGELRVGEISSLPYEDGTFDLIIDNECLSYNSFEASQNIFNEIARALKKGGKLFSKTFSRGCWGDETGKNMGHNAWLVAEGPLEGKGYTRFTEKEEIPVLIGRKFEVNEISLITRSMGEKEIREWVITATKI